MFKLDIDFIYIIFMVVVCYAWSRIIADKLKLFDEFLRYAEKKNKERENNADSN